MVNVVNVSLSPAAFAAVYALVSHVRLGDVNAFDTALKDTLIAWEIQNLDSLLDEISAQVGFPQVITTASDEDGVVFNLV